MTPQGTLFGVVDCFAGSCNGLYSILRHLPRAEGIGFEFEPVFFDEHAQHCLARRTHPPFPSLPFGVPLVAFLAPPWAEALSAETGLDLGSTKPPIAEIVAEIERAYSDTPILYVVEVHERLVPAPLAALRAGFEWSELSIYDLAGPTGRHGVLLGTRRW